MRFRHQRRAFTLIELLVVIAIIGILVGLTFNSFWLKKADYEIQVEIAANGVERKLLEARNLAITTGKPACVVFHIENNGSGRIFKNRSATDARDFPGRHWCAVIGGVYRMPQSPAHDLMNAGSAQRLASTVEALQVGERFYLPKGTRFLALGDAEDNLNTSGSWAVIPQGSTDFRIAASDWSKGTKTRTGNGALSDTYPRPWFGYLTGSGTAYTLNAFGGYDHGIYGSGLDYECSYRKLDAPARTDLDIVDSTNTRLCDCWNTGDPATPAKNGLLEEMRPCCDTVGTPRPLINGYWYDYAIIFLPDGQARQLSFYNRFSMMCAIEWNPTSRTAPKNEASNGPWGWVFFNNGNVDGPSKTFIGRDDAIIHSLGEAIGGPAITIAKDSLDGSPDFTSSRHALNSMLPMRRLVISEPTGGVRSIRPYASIQKWLDAIEKNVPLANRIWGNGWVYCDVTDADTNKIRVTGAVEPEMLEQHNPYPWIKPKP